MKRVKAKITRTVTEIAIVLLDKDGMIEEYEEFVEELDWEDGVVNEIKTVFSVHPS